MALLEVEGLVKYYGRRRVVDGISFTVGEGEVVGLLGPNGAGKTTSFRMTVGMLRPYAGVVRFDGVDVTHMPMYRRARLGMGYLSQEPSIFRNLSVEQNLLAVLETMEGYAKSAERRRAAEELLDQFGLLRLRKNEAVRLSGGERRRLEIARCLISDPSLILLDEPFTGIDPKAVGDIQQIIRNLRDGGIAMLITDHNVDQTLRITDRAYVICDGRVFAHGTPFEIVSNDDVRNVYLGHSYSSSAYQRAA
jgi:lipopolysaccharide export system ATP-binding protein